MSLILGGDRFRFLVSRIRERLWVRPLAICILSVIGVLVAKLADGTRLDEFVPRITTESIENLLSIMTASMLMIATFALGAMVSAYASASNSATPRTFPLVIADDVSQNALSSFIGAFIFSTVALIALKNDYFERAGLFVIFILTVGVFGIVILTFVRWVDRIARLGRLGTTIDKVEIATARALKQRRDAPTLCARPAGEPKMAEQAVFAPTVGYVQRVDVAALQACAEQIPGRVRVAALPGTFAAPGRVLAYVSADSGSPAEVDSAQLAKAFLIGGERRFEEDPRFGLVVLSEIACRALSPAVNDPGTAIDIIGTLVRLFVLWSAPPATKDSPTAHYDRVEVPELSIRDMFDDAFRAIARDGAASVEVSLRLLKALESLASIGHPAIRDAAIQHARLALRRAEKALTLPEDVAAVREVARFAS